MTSEYRPLAKLSAEFDCSAFDSGAEELDEWLKRRALKGQEVGNATTFVVVHDSTVFGYYALASGAVERDDAPRSVRQNAPQPTPVLLIARLAVDRRAQGRGIGRRLVQDALVRSLQISEQVGFRALIVHSRHEAARDFYVHHVPAFVPSPTEELHLLLPLQQIRTLLAQQ